MGKIAKRIHHKDNAAVIEDHAHKLPSGEYTSGGLLKPNSSQAFPHTHLYQDQGQTKETGIAFIGGNHTHETLEGVTSGPMPIRKDVELGSMEKDPGGVAVGQ